MANIKAHVVPGSRMRPSEIHLFFFLFLYQKALLSLLPILMNMLQEFYFKPEMWQRVNPEEVSDE